MSIDAYSPCPCGSGKKLKFCCHAVAGDMEKVQKFRETNQPRIAWQNLEALERKHPGNPWVAINKAEILLEDDEVDEATELLETLVQAEPDHKYALGMFAIAQFASDGFELAKPAIHRAFQRCVRDFPDLVADLAMGVASAMLNDEHFLAVRAHLALALRVAPDENKSDIFLRLMEFDSNRRIPYPLRSVHELVPLDFGESEQEEVRKAKLLNSIGCWRPAARVLEKLAERHPDDAAVWFDLGLCQAWDGDERAASESFHKAAGLQSDFEIAVEWETLAQLLDYSTTEEREQMVSRRYVVPSVSKLLSKLDEHDRITRVNMSPDSELADVTAGMYYILEHPERMELDPRSYTLENVPNVLAQVTVFDAPSPEELEEDEEFEDDEGPIEPRAYLGGTQSEGLEAAIKQWEEAAGDLVRLDEEESEEFFATVPSELASLVWRWHFPEETPLRLRSDLERQAYEHVTGQVWPEEPLKALNGKSPKDAAGDPELKVPLRAAISVLDAYCDRSRFALDRNAMFERFGLEPPQPVVFESETELQKLTAPQLLRIPVQQLSDEQLQMLVQRAALVHHGGFLFDVLTEVLSRPQCLEQFERQRLYLSYIDICRERGRYDLVFETMAKAKADAKQEDNAFELILQWSMRELTIRVEDPQDEEITDLLRHFNDYYLPKLPNLRETLSGLLSHFGLEAPWDDESAEPAIVTAGDGGKNFWSPGGTQPEPAGEKKLWLPGQD